MRALSLFSGAGIAEFYLRDSNIDVVLANEISPSRAEAHRLLHPDCEVLTADITKSETQERLIRESKNRKIDVIIATPPCQGLSSAGSNKTDDKLFTDPRNYLVLSALNIVNEVLPDYFIIENVPRFQQMKFTTGNDLKSLLALLQDMFSDKYEIDCEVLNAADYGVPQTRMRVVYRMWKKGLTWRKATKRPRITLHDAIGHLPSLEAGQSSSIKNHYARSHPQNHITCMQHTPTGQSAFNNEEHYPKKPDGSRIKGFPNSYKRMRWDIPAPTITMRNEIISSQENVHPGYQREDGTWSDARVLTMRELLIVSSLPPELDIPGNLTETAFRQLIGEGIPPRMMEAIMKGIGVSEGT